MLARCFDAVLFDLDGTLVDTAPDLHAHLNRMLAELGRPGLGLEEIRPMIGDGVRRLLIRGLEASGGVPADLDLEALFARFVERYSAAPVRLGAPFPGVVETLRRLAAAGVRMGVCTNKPQRPTERILSTLGLDRWLAVAIGGDRLAARKPDPSHLRAVLDGLGALASRAVLVGDSETDVMTARAAAMPCILVSFGYTPVPAAQLGADHVVDHFADLVPLLETIAAHRLDSQEARLL